MTKGFEEIIKGCDRNAIRYAQIVNQTGFAILQQKNYNEKEKFPDGRSNVSWIKILTQKL